MVAGVDYSIEYPAVVNDVPCCGGGNSSTGKSTCGLNITIVGRALGIIELTFVDQSETENRTDDLVYTVGVVRPDRDVKDFVRSPAFTFAPIIYEFMVSSKD